MYNSDKNKAVISYLMDNSPAEKSGILPLDEIVSVNGEDVTDMDLDTIVSKVRGPKDTTVEIVVYRPDDNLNHTFKITRDSIDIQSVAGEVLDGNIGYVYISGFKANTYDQLMTELNTLKSQGIKGLIRDLRDNPGGLLTSVEKIADEFIP